jgi:hypothetical protein
MKYNFCYSCLTKHDLSIEITKVHSLGQDFPPIRLLNSTYACDLDQYNYVYLSILKHQISYLIQIQNAKNHDIQFIELVWRDCNTNMKAMVKSQAFVALNYTSALVLNILFTFLFSINFLFFSSLFPEFKCFRG